MVEYLPNVCSPRFRAKEGQEKWRELLRKNLFSMQWKSLDAIVGSAEYQWRKETSSWEAPVSKQLSQQGWRGWSTAAEVAESDRNKSRQVYSTHSRYSPRDCCINVMAEWRSENVRWVERAPKRNGAFLWVQEREMGWLGKEKGNHRNLNLKDCIILVKQEMKPLPEVSKKKISRQNVGWQVFKKTEVRENNEGVLRVNIQWSL